MVMTDPIADMLTRIRNANDAGHKTVEMPASKEKKAIAQILLEEGYISKVDYIADEKQGVIKITLKYGENKSRVVAGIKRISKPGLRVYAGKDDVPKVLNGLGIAIVSTSKGVMTDKKARKAGVGGEVICYVW
jgi:small subunit ribosomal protein S8